MTNFEALSAHDNLLSPASGWLEKSPLERPISFDSLNQPPKFASSWRSPDSRAELDDFSWAVAVKRQPDLPNAAVKEPSTDDTPIAHSDLPAAKSFSLPGLPSIRDFYHRLRQLLPPAIAAAKPSDIAAAPVPVPNETVEDPVTFPSWDDARNVSSSRSGFYNTPIVQIGKTPDGCEWDFSSTLPDGTRRLHPVAAHIEGDRPTSFDIGSILPPPELIAAAQFYHSTAGMEQTLSIPNQAIGQSEVQNQILALPDSNELLNGYLTFLGAMPIDSNVHPTL